MGDGVRATAALLKEHPQLIVCFFSLHMSKVPAEAMQIFFVG